MTYEEYCEIMDNSNFYIDSENPYDMKIVEALEKQISKKPSNLRFTPDGFMHWNCAQCGESNRYEYTINYCNMCGQAIDWSEVE